MREKIFTESLHEPPKLVQKSSSDKFSYTQHQQNESNYADYQAASSGLNTPTHYKRNLPANMKIKQIADLNSTQPQL